jgi:putative pyruvate formate lyase activating enzyme
MILQQKTEHCTLCPRQCGVNRMQGERGICGETDQIRVARASLHMWEEPCISGEKGSGTVFFSGCTLHCIFCQNAQIEHGRVGKTVSESELVDVFLRLQEKGANNINLVTPGHFADKLVTTIELAKKRGLIVPIVYNTSAYETVETIRMFDGLVDIYLPDLKYTDAKLSENYSHAADYFPVAKKAIAEMVRQTKKPLFQRTSTGEKMDAKEYNAHCDEEEMFMLRGTIVRHLLLPGQTADSKRVLSYLFKTYGDDIFVSIMNQYTPMEAVKNIPPLNRKVTEKEYEEVVDYAISLGIENAFIQEGDTATESFIPDFSLQGL